MTDKEREALNSLRRFREAPVKMPDRDLQAFVFAEELTARYPELPVARGKRMIAIRGYVWSTKHEVARSNLPRIERKLALGRRASSAIEELLECLPTGSQRKELAEDLEGIREALKGLEKFRRLILDYCSIQFAEEWEQSYRERKARDDAPSQ
jgi:hypothetical protein